MHSECVHTKKKLWKRTIQTSIDVICNITAKQFYHKPSPSSTTTTIKYQENVENVTSKILYMQIYLSKREKNSKTFKREYSIRKIC